MNLIVALSMLLSAAPAGDGGAPVPSVLQLPDHCQFNAMMSPDCLNAAPAKAECPSQREDVPVGQLCGMEGRTSAPVCKFGNEVCRCVHHQYCGGPTPTAIQQSGMFWECKAAPKAGDCPESAPVNGSVCSKKGQTCGSTGCGSSVDCTCSKKGRWVCATRYWAPPP